jgi:Protein of unknown function (DUF4230)
LKNTLSYFTVYALGAVVGGVATYFAVQYYAAESKSAEVIVYQQADSLSQVLIPDTATVQEISSALQSVCKLVHTEKTYSLVVRYKVPYTVLGNEVSSLNSHIVVNAKAKVAVGIDYKKVEFVVDETSKTISVGYMPNSEILYTEIDYDFSGSDNLFNRVGISNFAAINRAAKAKVSQYIIEDHSLLLFNTASESKFFQDIILLCRMGNWKFVNSFDDSNSNNSLNG